MRWLGWRPVEGWLPPDTWQAWLSNRFLRGTWRHRTSSPEGREDRAPEAGPGAQAPRGSGFHTWCHRTTPRGFGPVEAIPEHPVSEGCVEAPDL
jgi:hypothetical protein